MGLGTQLRALTDEIQQSSIAAPQKAALTQSVTTLADSVRAFERDRVFYRIVAVILGVIILAVISAVTILLLSGITGYDALTAIGAATVGGLVGLIAPATRSAK